MIGALYPERVPRAPGLLELLECVVALGEPSPGPGASTGAQTVDALHRGMVWARAAAAVCQAEGAWDAHTAWQLAAEALQLAWSATLLARRPTSGTVPGGFFSYDSDDGFELHDTGEVPDEEPPACSSDDEWIEFGLVPVGGEA